MQYDDVIATMFESAPEATVPTPTVGASTARRFRDAIEPIAMHAVWSRLTNERLAHLGFDFTTAYVGGRAAALGTPSPGTVAATFAVFEPSMIGGAAQAAAAVCSREELLAVRARATSESLEQVLGADPELADGVADEVAEVADAMAAAVEHAPRVGRPLFSGLLDQPWPESPAGRLWRACDLAREHRGDGHVAVCAAAGLDAVEVNVLTELWVGYPFASYSASRAWSPEQLEGAAARLAERGLLDGHELTAQGREFRASIEAATDAIDRVAEALGADADRIVDRLAGWSQQCVEAGLFPPDLRKRAAG